MPDSRDTQVESEVIASLLYYCFGDSALGWTRRCERTLARFIGQSFLWQANIEYLILCLHDTAARIFVSET